MGGILNALRRGESDAIRESTSLTTAYLLEQNRKFEAFMRDRIAELESRVTSQQARPSARTTAEESLDGDELFGDYYEDQPGDEAETGSLYLGNLDEDPMMSSFMGIEAGESEDAEPDLGTRTPVSPGDAGTTNTPAAVEGKVEPETPPPDEPPDWMSTLMGASQPAEDASGEAEAAGEDLDVTEDAATGEPLSAPKGETFVDEGTGAPEPDENLEAEEEVVLEEPLPALEEDALTSEEPGAPEPDENLEVGEDEDAFFVPEGWVVMDEEEQHSVPDGPVLGLEAALSAPGDEDGPTAQVRPVTPPSADETEADADDGIGGWDESLLDGPLGDFA
jgi:hypothetical protein